MTKSLAGVADQLDEELVGWLTTVTRQGQPQSTIVWYLRDGDELLVYSQPDRPKLRNIAANPRVAFNLRSDDVGGSFLTLEGRARVVDHSTPADQLPAYVAKYRHLIDSYGWTPESFAADYSVMIRIEVDQARQGD